MNTHSLQSCRLSPEALRAPLPFDLYNSKGMLLIRKGAQIKTGAECIFDQPLYRSPDENEPDGREVLQRLEAVFQGYGRVVADWDCRIENVVELKRLVSDLVHLCGKHSDLCVATAFHLATKSHATKHAFVTAIIAILLGDALGWNLRRQHVLGRAALTMNVSLLSMHDDWARIRGELNRAQKSNVHRHPGLSAELLAQTPGVDLAWLATVDQHHENLDGSGYPLGLGGAEIGAEARVLRIADAWCALVMPRSGKARKTPKEAFVEMGRHIGSHFDHAFFQALKGMMGAYPPGTLVRLANRETAIVMRWDRRGSVPLYATSVFSPAGELSREFKLRQLSRHGFEIRDYTYLNMAQMARFSVSRIWASGSA